MATVEHQLISRLVKRGELPVALEWGITPDDFMTAECRGLWQRLLTYYQSPATMGAIPGTYAMAELSPGWVYCDDKNMTTAALCHEVRRGRIIVEAKKSALTLAEDIDVDPVAALAQHQAQIVRLSTLSTRSNDLEFSSCVEELKRDYLLAKSGLSMSKVLWPWPLMNEVTGGIQKDDYIVFYGRPKNKKTWVLCKTIAHTYESNENSHVLVYTKEMTPKNMLFRVSACMAGLPYQELRTGKMTLDQEESLDLMFDEVRRLQKEKRLIVLSGRDANGGDTVAWLQGKIEHYKPCVAFVDGIYLLKSSGGPRQADWSRVTEISRDLRACILHTEVPIVGTMQANRKAAGHSGAELDEIAYADAIGQDATGIFRCIAEKPDKDTGKETIALIAGGSREYKLYGIRIGGEPAIDFNFKSELTEKDIERAKRQDLAAEEADNPQPRQPKPINNNAAARRRENKLAREQLTNMNRK